MLDILHCMSPDKAEVFKTSTAETENHIMGLVNLLGLKIIDCATTNLHEYFNTFINIIMWALVGGTRVNIEESEQHKEA